MLKDFLKNFKEDRVETFTFVLLTIFTYGLYAIYWLGKLNKSFKGATKRHLVAENLIIVLGIFSFIEIMFVSFAVGEAALGSEASWSTFSMLNNLSYIGTFGLFIMNIIIAFHVKTQITVVYISDKIKFEGNPILNFNSFFTFLFGAMYVCYKLNKILDFRK